MRSRSYGGKRRGKSKQNHFTIRQNSNYVDHLT
jgi:hypothetical protein